MSRSFQFDSELIDIKTELENIIGEILSQDDTHDKIDSTRLNAFLNTFDLSSKNSLFMRNFQEQLEDFQQILIKATDKVKDRCQVIQHQLATLDHRHQGVSAYTQNQYLTSRRGF